MSVRNLSLPEHYFSKLDIMETEIAIKLAKDTFERELARCLELTRVSAPLFVQPETGLNDDLNGVERPVQFDILDLGSDVQIVHSLAKWKRLALARYGFAPGTGLYTDMNAIRRDEVLDNLHSVYVDQWDWEKVITREQRCAETLKDTVRQIMKALCKTQETLANQFSCLERYLPEQISFVTSQQLEDEYPALSPKEREDAAAKKYGAVFIMQIGGALKSGKPHDGRAPDYDDWSLNGDIIIWYPVLGRALELSSMGIRVDADALRRQLEISGHTERASMPFHKMLLEGRLPLTMGGGVGPVAASVWRCSRRPTSARCRRPSGPRICATPARRRASTCCNQGELLKKFPLDPFKTFDSGTPRRFAARAPRETKVFADLEKVPLDPFKTFDSGTPRRVAARAPRETNVFSGLGKASTNNKNFRPPFLKGGGAAGRSPASRPQARNA